MNLKCYLLIIALIFLNSFDAQASHENSSGPTVKLSLSTYKDSSGVLYLAVTYRNTPKWHTYWKNPGDSGTAVSNRFYIGDNKIQLRELEWPTPVRYITKGDLWSYAYFDTYTFFYKASQEILKNSFELKAKWLSCKNICVPEQTSIKGSIEGGTFISKTPLPFTITKENLKEHFNNLPIATEYPKEIDLTLARSVDGQNLVLFYNLSDVSKSAIKDSLNILTPFPMEPFGYKHEFLYHDNDNNLYGKIEIDWDGVYLEPEVPLPTDGKFQTPFKLKFLYQDIRSNKISIIEKEFSSFSLEAAKKLDGFFSLLKGIKTSNNNSVPKVTDINIDKDRPTVKKEEITFWYYLLLAFIGGLILNVMPCVLPIISLKLFGLIKQRNLRHQMIVKHNILYTLGVLFSFLILALSVIALKSGGEEIGWGFHLQSPSIVAILIVILFILTLNLFGLFEFGIPGGKYIGNIKLKNSAASDFFSGALATILSTPCSAPFLGVALSFAFTATSASIIGIFLGIGLGLSFPFILIAIFPKTIFLLPRPGKWMEHVKKFLGLTLIITMIWLYDVLMNITDTSTTTIKLNLSMAIIFFGFYLYKHMTKNKIIAGLIMLMPVTLMYQLVSLEMMLSRNPQITFSKVKWMPWSVEKQLKLHNNGDLVFIYFTARWCVTCKAFEKLVLKTDDFKELVESNNIKLLKGDWTRSDPKITRWLKEQGLAGVPAYFLYKLDGTLINFGETISIQKVKDALSDK